jgi:hypothetical protein
MIEAVEFNQWALTSRARDLSPPQRVPRSSISDQVHISVQGRAANTAGSSESTTGAQSPSMEEKREVDKLKTQDQQVKAHERAHMAAGGGLIVGGGQTTPISRDRMGKCQLSTSIVSTSTLAVPLR